jgi:hypothetical protein
MTTATRSSGLAPSAGTPVVTCPVTVRTSFQPSERSQPSGPDFLGTGHFRASRPRGERPEVRGEMRIGAGQVAFDFAQCPPIPAQVHHGLRERAVEIAEPRWPLRMGWQITTSSLSVSYC